MLKSSKLSDRFKKKDETANEGTEQLIKSDDNFSNSLDFSTIEADLQSALLNKIDSTPVWFEYSDLKQRELIRNFIDNYLNLINFSADEQQKEKFANNLYDVVSGLGQLDYLLSRGNVSAVFVNGTGNVHIEIDGKILNTEISLSEIQIKMTVNNIFKLCGVKFDSTKKIWNLKNEKYCITVMFPPVSENGINISVRKILTPDIETFYERNITSKEIFDFIVSAVSEGKNIVISGDINSGKTFFSNVLINVFASDKRFAVVEKYPQLSTDGENLMKFLIPDNQEQLDAFVSTLLKISPEFVFADLNVPLTDMSEKKGSVITLRASSTF